MDIIETLWGKDKLVQKTVQIEESLYEELVKLSENMLDASVSKIMLATENSSLLLDCSSIVSCFICSFSFSASNIILFRFCFLSSLCVVIVTSIFEGN